MKDKTRNITNLKVLVVILTIISLVALVSVSFLLWDRFNNTAPAGELKSVEIQAPRQIDISEERIQVVLAQAYTKFKDNQDGKNADYIKALAVVDSTLFGITLVTADGKIYDEDVCR